MKTVPKAEERKLRRQAKTKGLKGEHLNAYVYGTLRKMGCKPKKK